MKIIYEWNFHDIPTFKLYITLKSLATEKLGNSY